jgi:hypothetical protein
LATNRFTLCKCRRRPSSMHKKERASFSRTLPKPYHRPKLNTRRRSAPI